MAFTIFLPSFVSFIFHALTLGEINFTPTLIRPALDSSRIVFLMDLYFEKPIFARISVNFISPYLSSRYNMRIENGEDSAVSMVSNTICVPIKLNGISYFLLTEFFGDYL